MAGNDARSFLQEHHRAVLATRRASGDLQLSPVLAGVDDDGRAVSARRRPVRRCATCGGIRARPCA